MYQNHSWTTVVDGHESVHINQIGKVTGKKENKITKDTKKKFGKEKEKYIKDRKKIHHTKKSQGSQEKVIIPFSRFFIFVTLGFAKIIYFSS